MKSYEEENEKIQIMNLLENNIIDNKIAQEISEIAADLQCTLNFLEENQIDISLLKQAYDCLKQEICNQINCPDKYKQYFDYVIKSLY